MTLSFKGRDAPPCLTFASDSFDFGPMAALLSERRPDWDIRIWPEAGWEHAEIAVCWDTPKGLYRRMSSLRLIHGIAAGVDNIVRDDVCGATVCRVVDPDQVRGMIDYVLWSVLYFQRRFDQVLRQQDRGEWKRPVLRTAKDLRVGVAGLGAMGLSVATALLAHGYRVSGFSRTARSIEGVDCFAGDSELASFLAPLDVLVCALPLTSTTRGILDSKVFAGLPNGAALVHVGRGEHLVTADLRAALGSGHLCGAIVDVFPVEPLEPNDPLWSNAGLIVTPHMATMASPAAIIDQLVTNVESFERNAPLQHVIEMATAS